MFNTLFRVKIITIISFLLNNTVVKCVSDVTLKLINKSFGVSIITKEFGLVGGMHGKIEHWAINK